MIWDPKPFLLIALLCLALASHPTLLGPVLGVPVGDVLKGSR